MDEDRKNVSLPGKTKWEGETNFNICLGYFEQKNGHMVLRVFGMIEEWNRDEFEQLVQDVFPNGVREILLHNFDSPSEEIINEALEHIA